MDQVYIFRKALENPMEVSVADFEQLLTKYPYSQPIIYAYERKKFLEGQSIDKQRTLIYGNNPFWLRDYLQKPIEFIPEIEVDSDDYIAYEELDGEGQIEETEVEAVDVESISDVEEVIAEPANDLDEVEDEIVEGQDEEIKEEEPAFAFAAGYDIEREYAGEEELDVESEELVSVELEEEVPSQEEENKRSPEEDISLYNDELMPYSFRWWLYKTRMEHADTYQPFSSPVLPKQQKGQFDPKKLDEAILDQQIRENIFHLQDPSDKLSDKHKKETVEFKSTEMMDEVIEKFIREEPQIQPPKAETINTENKARSSSEDQLQVVTETLANIYETQGMYEKAIMVFRKLISDNPEKKSYFATRIKEIEQKL
ncbi:hypothetical protein [Sphingobacterium sp.]|uniref:hypothetical protein n=1 Tax=Sphingobacterium sp. TaxID=341027 RepID=UPI0028B187E1|nr:hypothetical protein [Sphingobacterium sp.]